MTIKSLTTEEILSQIKYLEQNISKGSPSYRTNRLNRIRSLKASLRFASWWSEVVIAEWSLEVRVSFASKIYYHYIYTYAYRLPFGGFFYFITLSIPLNQKGKNSRADACTRALVLPIILSLHDVRCRHFERCLLLKCAFVKQFAEVVIFFAIKVFCVLFFVYLCISV